MSILSPPKPPPLHEDPEALIEEARRRARRRRLAVAGAAVVVLAIVGIVLAVVLTRGRGTSAAVPDGFHLIQARGPVAHGRLEEVGPGWAPQMIDVATGEVSRPGTVYDIWWDRRSGLGRFVVSVAGRVKEDVAGQVCPAQAGSHCSPPEPFDAVSSRRWPVDSTANGVKRGKLYGRDVIWVRIPERVALDARTHRLFARPQYLHNQFIGYVLSQRLRDVSAKSVSFLVPDPGAFRATAWPPVGPSAERTKRARLGALSSTFGTAPLWAGPRFRGKTLQSVETGIIGMKGRNGRLLRPVKFVRLRYGPCCLELEEYFGKGPYVFKQGPRPGTVASYGSTAALTKNGLLVLASASFQFTPRAAVELARALRPVSGR